MNRELFRDLAQIYQQKAMESLSEEDLAHAKRYRIAAETEVRVAELEATLEEALGALMGFDYERRLRVIAKIEEVL